MEIYTYSEARQNLSSVLDKAESTGKIIIRRKDGRSFALIPERTHRSPLDVPSIQASVSTKELVKIVRKERGRTIVRKRRGKGRELPARRSSVRRAP